MHFDPVLTPPHPEIEPKTAERWFYQNEADACRHLERLRWSRRQHYEEADDFGKSRLLLNIRESIFHSHLDNTVYLELADSKALYQAKRFIRWLCRKPSALDLLLKLERMERHGVNIDAAMNILYDTWGIKNPV